MRHTGYTYSNRLDPGVWIQLVMIPGGLEPTLNALVQSGKFNVTVVKRPSSSASFPDSVTVRTADLSSVDSVTAAFEGQDAIVSTVRTASLPEYCVLVEAAIAAFFRPTLAATWLTPRPGFCPYTSSRL